jgi:cysteine desulfurase
MKQKIYLDHSATTCMDQEVKKAMDTYFEKCFGNPNSFHSFGLEAAEALNKARVKVQGLLNATSEKEIVFTSGGTESVNLAIQGIARGSKKKEIIHGNTRL